MAKRKQKIPVNLSTPPPVDLSCSLGYYSYVQRRKIYRRRIGQLVGADVPKF